MPGSWPPHELPYLADDNCTVTSLNSRQYNCIAWAAGDDGNNWWPDPMGIGTWPAGAPRVVTLDAFIKAFETKGYKLCYNNSREDGLEKVAIYAKMDQISGVPIPTHAALQLETGEWTSKLGPFEDVRHRTIDDVNGPVYGKGVCYMSRPRP